MKKVYLSVKDFIDTSLQFLKQAGTKEDWKRFYAVVLVSHPPNESTLWDKAKLECESSGMLEV